jgi:APA family basic amino acid/polyamine antiporter
MADFKRSLNLLDAVMLVSGSMIGSGIFLVSSEMSRNLGSAGWLMLAWVVAGVLTILAALAYGELSAMMPNAGGQYVYIQRAFGKLPAFLYGWTVFMVIQTGVIAAVAMAFANYSAELFPILDPETPLLSISWITISRPQALAISSIFLLTAFNSMGVQHGKTLQTVFTSAKILALLALIGFGLFVGMGLPHLSENFSDAWSAFSVSSGNGSREIFPLSGWALLSALGIAMVGSLFSSDAWNNVTFIAGEIRNPSRNLPLSLFFGTVIVTGLYLMANLAYLALLPLTEIQEAVKDRVGTAAAEVIFGDPARYLMAGLIMVSTFGCNNGIILAGGRLFYAMARDGLFFQKAARLNGKGVPGFALWVQCIWASVLCLSGKYGDLLQYTTFASLLFYIVTISGLFVLRSKEPDTPRPYKAWGYPMLPAAYILFASLFCINLLVTTPAYTGAGLAIVALGLPVYFLQKKGHSEAKTD